MRITASTVQLASSQHTERATSREESLERWMGAAPRGAAARSVPPVEPAAAATDAASTADAGKPTAADGGADDGEKLSARDALDLAILRKFFGIERDPTRSARVARQAYDASSAATPRPAGAQDPGTAAPARAGWGFRYDRSETTVEREATSFAAQAEVTTADGRTIAVQTQLTMEHTQVLSSELHVRTGDAAPVDPLVLNLSGGAASFSGKTAFDVDADGERETVARLAPGSAYLALDRNGNGKVDSGAELFGPSTGSGFGELAALDQDQNGWIDEGDATFGALRLWSPGSGALQTLQAAGVGAISTRSAATRFDVRDAGGAVQATIARTGLYLREDGTAGTVQHVDLVA